LSQGNGLLTNRPKDCGMKTVSEIFGGWRRAG
jgi:hypothetical protein